MSSDDDDHFLNEDTAIIVLVRNTPMSPGTILTQVLNRLSFTMWRTDAVDNNDIVH